MKKSLKKSAALILGLAFILMIVPAVNSAELKGSKLSFIQIVKLPTLLIPSLLPFNGALCSSGIAGSLNGSPAGASGGRACSAFRPRRRGRGSLLPAFPISCPPGMRRAVSPMEHAADKGA